MAISENNYAVAALALVVAAAAFVVGRRSTGGGPWLDAVVAVAALAVIAAWVRRRGRRAADAVREAQAAVARDAAVAAERAAARHADELREARETIAARDAAITAAQRQLDDRTAALARALQSRAELLANMSHELRTPLNSIAMLSEALVENRGRTMTVEQVELASVIRRSGEELLALINEAHDLVRIEAGKQAIVGAQVRLVEVQDHLRRMFRPLAAQRDLSFEVEAADDLPVAIRTDWTRLAQILKNLIANALRFTERGGVTVRLHRGLPAGWRDEIAVADPIAIVVADTGIGIAADKQAGIFEAFAPIHTTLGRTFGGAGLGLAIARQLARRLAGDVVVDSAPGAGSTFSVVLPIAGPPLAEGSQRRGATPTTPCATRDVTHAAASPAATDAATDD